MLFRTLQQGPLGREAFIPGQTVNDWEQKNNCTLVVAPHPHTSTILFDRHFHSERDGGNGENLIVWCEKKTSNWKKKSPVIASPPPYLFPLSLLLDTSSTMTVLGGRSLPFCLCCAVGCPLLSQVLFFIFFLFFSAWLLQMPSFAVSTKVIFPNHCPYV